MPGKEGVVDIKCRKKDEVSDAIAGVQLVGNPISDKTNVGWRVFLETRDGNYFEASEVGRVVISNPRFGHLTYGESLSGPYDTWWFTEVGGGGSVIVPCARRIDGALYIGLLREKRPLAVPGSEKFVWNVPRGFVDPNETHDMAASRELNEEVGLPPERRLVRLLGMPGNPNSTFFNTAWNLPSGEQAGLRFYSCEIHEDELAAINDGIEPTRYRIAAQLNPAAKSIGEKIIGCEFWPVKDAVEITGDLFTRAGIALLLCRELK